MSEIKRKKLSKKLRFEIFKRDGFQCAYCGQSPPSVVLEIDHIEPISKGGADDISNYITACFDCNRGKSDIPLDKIPSKLSENIEVLKQKEEQLKEYRKFINRIRRREIKDINEIAEIYSEAFPDYQLSKTFKNVSLKRFIQKLPKHEVEEAMIKAVSLIAHKDNSIKYFCGICWKKIKTNGVR